MDNLKDLYELTRKLCELRREKGALVLEMLNHPECFSEQHEGNTMRILREYSNDSENSKKRLRITLEVSREKDWRLYDLLNKEKLY